MYNFGWNRTETVLETKSLGDEGDIKRGFSDVGFVGFDWTCLIQLANHWWVLINTRIDYLGSLQVT
jgi:hypothetical protein